MHMKFPQNFLWGAALSAYQAEGNNSNSDWWEWEKGAGKERSGMAARHYELYEQDFDLAKGLNHRGLAKWCSVTSGSMPRALKARITPT